MAAGGRLMSTPVLREVTLPDFGMPSEMPELPPEVYASRLERLRERADVRGYDRIVVYADREHSANAAFLTGFDPRFEEALLVIGPEGDPAVLVGNECWGIAGAAPVALRRHRFQDFSLPNQPRDRSRPLAEILRSEGIGPGSRVGVVGWKTYAHPSMSDLPAYLLDELRDLVGGGGAVENATDLFIDPADGLRVINEPEQIAALEWASCQTSSGMRSLLSGLRPGVTEREAVALLGWNGWPLSCHLMLTAGPRARHGLLSPGDRPIGRGDPFTSAYGIWGALTCRAGFVVEDAGELPEPIRDYVDRLVAPYFAAIGAWYAAIHVGPDRRGAPGDHRRAARRPVLRGLPQSRPPDPPRRVGGVTDLPAARPSSCAPAWRSRSTSSRRPGPTTSRRTSRTGSSSPTPRCGTSSRGASATCGRESSDGGNSCRRRCGIDLHPDVLPLSNLPAVLAPFLLRPDRAMSLAG